MLDGDLPRDLRRRTLAALGVPDAPPPDLDGLRIVYAAWCASVPFDNVRKCIALHENDRRPLPGTDAEDFLGAWLTSGTGGTCWAGANALHALLRSLGFDAHRAAGSMRDLDIANHGTTRVRLDDTEWLADSSMLTVEPLPLRDGLFTSPVALGVEVERTDRGHVVWFDTPPHPTLFPCRLLHDRVDHAFFADAYERSRASSPFNQSLYARRNRPDGKVVLRGATRYVRTREGTTAHELARDELVASLRDEIGIAPPMIERWVACGALEACYTPIIGPNTAPADLVPPSRRAVSTSSS